VCLNATCREVHCLHPAGCICRCDAQTSIDMLKTLAPPQHVKVNVLRHCIGSVVAVQLALPSTSLQLLPAAAPGPPWLLQLRASSTTSQYASCFVYSSSGQTPQACVFSAFRVVGIALACMRVHVKRAFKVVKLCDNFTLLSGSFASEPSVCLAGALSQAFAHEGSRRLCTAGGCA